MATWTAILAVLATRNPLFRPAHPRNWECVNIADGEFLIEQ
ncbi:hypothetical protein [Rhizobium leguminosarum]|nr:hypothetical protein [Rhizobium leguminosarum]